MTAVTPLPPASLKPGADGDYVGTLQYSEFLRRHLAFLHQLGFPET